MIKQADGIPQIPDYQDDSDQQKINVLTNVYKGAQDLGSDLTGWNDLYLKQQIKKAIRQIGYQFPSQVQKQAIPIIMQGKDLLCQARSGMGKTAVFIIGVLSQLSIVDGNYIPFNCVVMVHTRELAHQIFKDFRRIGKYLKNPELRIGCFFGGILADVQRPQLMQKQKQPHIVIGTPGRLWKFIKQGNLPLNKTQFLVVDECDKVLMSISMRRILQNMYIKMTNHSKQVMMFSATFSQATKIAARQFMSNQADIFVDSGKLTLEGLTQFNVFLIQKTKIENLMKILDKLKFNQGVIFVNRVDRAKKLTDLLKQKLFNPICIHSGMTQQQRLKSYDGFKLNHFRLLVATDLFGRGIDVQRVNLVINYDLPQQKDSYLHRIGRAGRFNTKGIVVNFVCTIGDQQQKRVRWKDVHIMQQIQNNLNSKINELPEDFDPHQYI